MKKDAEIEKYCKYCEKACVLSDGDVMLCKKYGVVKSSHVCRRFTYDPFKRVPKLKKDPPALEYVEI